MLSFYPHKATCDQQFHLYLGEDLCKTGHDFQHEEITEVGLFSLDKVKKMIRLG